MKLAAIAIASLTIALAGCGGGGGGSSSTSSTPKTTTAVSAANYKQLLQQIVLQIQTLTAVPPAPNSTPAEQADYAKKIQSAVSQARDQIAALKPSGKLAVANRALVEAFGTYADLLGQLATAAKNQDKAAVANIDTQIRAETAKMKAALTAAQNGG